MRIAVCEPLISEADIQTVTECLQSGWVSSAGKYLDQFEQEWANYCGAKFGIAVSNGTVALQLAVAALKLERGAEVIMPTFTILSCASAVIYNDLVPVFVDSEPRTWGMDVSQIESKITPRTRAIMVVHIYGHPVDMDPIHRLAARHGLAVIEDAAEAHGAEYLSGRTDGRGNWKRCGGMGTISTFSFYANKLITTGEGGMILTSDANLAERCRSMRNLCFQPGRRFYHEELGFNFRLTNMQAALGVSQMQRLPEIVIRKRAIADRYTQLLREVGGLTLPIEETWGRHVYWVYGIVLNPANGLEAKCIMERLKNIGIETRPFFLGMHEQPVLRERGLAKDQSHPVAERLARFGFYVPTGLAITDREIAFVVENLLTSLQ